MGACGNTKEIENIKPLNQTNLQGISLQNQNQTQNNPYINQQGQLGQQGQQIIYANHRNVTNNDVNNQIYQQENKFASNANKKSMFYLSFILI